MQRPHSVDSKEQVSVDSEFTKFYDEEFLSSLDEVVITEASLQVILFGKSILEINGRLQMEPPKRKFVWLTLGSVVVLSQWIMTMLPELVSNVYALADALYTLLVTINSVF